MAAKKRQRIILVCDNCHHRKIKCDRKLPCDSCKARGISALCRYSDLEKELVKQGKSTHEVKSSDEPASELTVLRHRVKELEAMIGVASLSNSNSSFNTPSDFQSSPSTTEYSDTNETTDFFMIPFENGSCVRVNQSCIISFPISFLSILRKDAAYLSFWHYNRNPSQQDKFLKHQVEGMGQLLDHRNEELTQTVDSRAQEYFGASYIPKYVKNSTISLDVKIAINLYMGQFGPLMFYDNYIPPNSSIYVKATHILPPKPIILEYLTVWFEKMEPYFPIFEKIAFTAVISRLVSDRDNGDVRVKLSIEKKPDLANLASLLFILRLTYSYVMVANNTTNRYKNLEKFPVYIDAVHIAKECLKEFNMSLRPSFEALQAYSVAKVYKSYSHDEGDGIRETDMYVRTLLYAASSCGLNRDPDIYHHEDLTWIERNHRRKFWFFLLSQEFFESALYGRRLFELDYADVKLEETNTPGDDFIYHTFLKILPMRGLMVKLMKMLMNINVPTNVTLFIDLSEQLAALVDNAYGDLSTQFHNQVNMFDNPKSTWDTYHLFAMKLLMMKLNYCLYIIFEKKGDISQSFKFYKRLSIITFIENTPLISVAFDNDNRVDPMFSIILGSSFLRLCFIYILNCATFTIHVNHTIRLYAGTEDKPKHLFELVKNVQYLWCYICTYTGCLSRRTFTAWRAMKASLYGMIETGSYQTFEDICLGRKASWSFTSAQMHELCEILEETVAVVAAKPSMVPFELSTQLLWLNVVPFDNSKSVEENMDIQRLHVNQIDNTWNNCVASMKETIPASFKNDETLQTTQIDNLLNTDVMDPSIGIMSGVENMFSLDDLFVNDTFFRL
ncbi:hypothetical protein PSN45_002501 [Yamadazyma tenuis]|uniref:Zn(2)-C6 fungal-type domain-containing protein n=1 Tax=Candida tenuis (strain ATCC 10573 / BCRC 21748 / CBS 615 / JCM 9827 / NBRC 10315 / NRRL Y-1498 / VKM Y-70) TaxID=590646 RepID=G3B090_CANTC|nr:uncharacterized protein CANTEDRAFT_133645 [Yamadazyma tenuis ATCC 10573]EGV65346.1 hypothetical protein CANTEDRAFT_133645 [Yamadazyma tenuis ATCC 10573]WEJ94995.1 hypothetical protein PSN45_002501 [Yamadazyma tenuis]